MIRKVSCKGLNIEEKAKRQQNKTKDNEYYLPHPTIKVMKFNNKEGQSQIQRETITLKCNRKQSYNPSQTASSVAILKIDTPNYSKQLQANNPSKNYVTKKVEGRKLRSTSNGQTPKKPLSKSAFKLQLTGRKREGTTKRINLQIETPTTKKPVQKLNLQEMNFDSYYNSNQIVTESKSIKTLKKPDLSQNYTASSELKMIYSRCKLIIEEYQEQLESVKRENMQLQEQNKRLRSQKSPKGKIVKD